MDFSFDFLTHRAAMVLSKIPAEFSKQVLPEGEVNAFEASFGKILFQEIKAGRFTILFTATARIKEFLQVQAKAPSTALQIIVARRGAADITVTGIGDLHLKEGQFMIIYSPTREDIYAFEKDADCELFSAYFPAELLQQFSSLFPLLGIFLESIHSAEATLLFKQAGWGNLQVNEIIGSLLQFHGEDSMRRLHFDKKIKELIFIVLLQEYTNAAVERRMIRKNLDGAYEARKIIETGTIKHLTIKKLAEQVGLNEVKLKTSFKLVFGTGVAEFMLHTRMEKAWKLVLETDKPIKEIAMITGYGSRQNFLTAFRKYFQCTPGVLRKRD